MQVKYTCVGTEVRKFVILDVSICVFFMWQDKLGKSVNMRAMNMLGKVEEKVGKVHVCTCINMWMLCFLTTRNACIRCLLLWNLLSYVHVPLFIKINYTLYALRRRLH